MNKSKLLIGGSAALVSIIAVAGVAMTTFAAQDDISTSTADRKMICDKSGKQLTDAERQKMENDKQAKMAEMKTKMEAEKAAINAGDYQAWVKAVGENSPILEKINQDNFSKYAEAYKLRLQSDDIMKELGLDNIGHGGNFKFSQNKQIK